MFIEQLLSDIFVGSEDMSKQKTQRHYSHKNKIKHLKASTNERVPLKYDNSNWKQISSYNGS